ALLTSQAIASALALVSPASVIASSSTFLRRPQNTVFQPALSSVVATLLPIPVPAPVTMAVFSCMAVIVAPRSLLEENVASQMMGIVASAPAHKKRSADKKGGHWRPP